MTKSRSEWHTLYSAFPLRRFETWAQRDFNSKIAIPTVAVANVESMIPQAIDLLFEIFKESPADPSA
jgi:hypothetical protein